MVLKAAPDNLFIRGLEVAGTFRLAGPTTFYRYVHAGARSSQPLLARLGGLLPASTYLSIFRHYSADEALKSLALPGPPPTHVLEIVLPATTFIAGPAYITPLSTKDIWWRPETHRPGDGIEFQTLEDVFLLTSQYAVHPLA